MLENSITRYARCTVYKRAIILFWVSP